MPRGQGSGLSAKMRRGFGIGRMGGKKRGGPGGFCLCPKCGEKVAHQQGVPCYSLKCPKCGAVMMRE